jgi:hypothetical protein
MWLLSTGYQGIILKLEKTELGQLIGGVIQNLKDADGIQGFSTITCVMCHIVWPSWDKGALEHAP